MAVSFTTISVSFNSAVLSGATPQLIADFSTLTEVATLTVSPYVVAVGLRPMT